jgi:hypothetical protein
MAEKTVVAPNTMTSVSAGVVAIHDGDAPSTVTADGAWLVFGPTSGTWRVAPVARKYFVSIIERHIRSDADRVAGVRDVPLGLRQGRDARIAEYLAEALAKIEATPDETYEVDFYGCDIAGFNTEEIVRGNFHGRDLRGVFRRAGWTIDRETESKVQG